jgi:hypothetical protein
MNATLFPERGTSARPPGSIYKNASLRRYAVHDNKGARHMYEYLSGVGDSRYRKPVVVRLVSNRM